MHAGQQWAGRPKENKRYSQVYTVDIYTRKREPQFPKERDLVTDDSTQLSTYIKTSANEEKFQY